MMVFFGMLVNRFIFFFVEFFSGFFEWVIMVLGCILRECSFLMLCWVGFVFCLLMIFSLGMQVMWMKVMFFLFFFICICLVVLRKGMFLMLLIVLFILIIIMLQFGYFFYVFFDFVGYVWYDLDSGFEVFFFMFFFDDCRIDFFGGYVVVEV